jgi:hypothetical protein
VAVQLVSALWPLIFTPVRAKLSVMDHPFG